MMKLEHVALWTRNLERLKAYYVRYFQGVPGPLYHNKVKAFKSYFITFNNGLRLELMSKPGLCSSEPKPAGDNHAEGEHTRSVSQHSGWTHIAFGADGREEVDRKAAELQKQGFPILDGPRLTGDGYYEFTTRDPDRNLLEVSADAHSEDSYSGISDLILQTMKLRLAICLLPPDTPIPDWVTGAPLWTVSRTPEETSVVCPEEQVPEGVTAEGNWLPLWVKGNLDFSLTGILSGLLDPLKMAGIPAFVVSTYRTDYLLVRAGDYHLALSLLGKICHIEQIRSLTGNDI